MRLLTAFAILLLWCTGINAQQRPQYTQYILNTFIINPSVAGIENYVDVKASYRKQWSGIEGAPVTSYLSIQGPLHKSDKQRENPTSVFPYGENPRGKQYWNDYTATDPHAGIGVTFINDKTGPLNRFSATAAYAYHLPLTNKLSFSAGIAAGIQNLRLNTDALYFGQNIQIDPAVTQNGILNTWKPDINAGVWLYSPTFFAGAAVQNIIPENFTFNSDTLKQQSGKLLPHLFITAGYRLLLTDNINFLPSLMLKYLQPAVMSFDINVKCLYKDFFWVGAAYRHNDGLAGMIGINVNSTFSIGYSYDQSNNGLKSVTKGSHELVVGFMLNNKYGDWCPRNVW